jgi:hypothetical protein
MQFVAGHARIAFDGSTETDLNRMRAAMILQSEGAIIACKVETHCLDLLSIVFETIGLARNMVMTGEVVGLRIPIEMVEGEIKLNQDKSTADRLGVIAALESQKTPNGVAVAKLMREQLDVAKALR